MIIFEKACVCGSLLELNFVTLMYLGAGAGTYREGHPPTTDVQCVVCGAVYHLTVDIDLALVNPDARRRLLKSV